MRGRRTWGALVALTLTVGGCSLIEGDDDATSSPTSSSATSRPSSTPAQSSFELFDPPREGRDWVVLVEDPGDTDRVADELEAEGLSLTSVNTAVGMVTLRSEDDDVAERAKGVDGVTDAVTDRSASWTPEPPAEPDPGDTTPAADLPSPPDVPEGGDPLDGWLWGMEAVNARGAHEVTPGRPEVRVGVMDTGIDASHPDLAPVLDRGLSKSFVSDIPDIDGECEHENCIDPVGEDDGGHGTHVAGTIAAAANDLGVTGVAPGVTLVDLRAGQDAGLFFLGPTVNALTHAADQRLDVVNMSFYVDPWLYACEGGAPGDSPEQAAFQDVMLELVHRSLDLTHEAGVTLVTSAGNDGADMGDPSRDSSSPNYGGDPRNRTIDPKTCERLPLAGEHVISVASVDEGNVRSTFSNWTSTPDDGLVDVAAPGGEETSGRGGILSAASRSVVTAEGLVDAEGRVTETGADIVVRSCPESISGNDPDPDGRCGLYVWNQGTSMASPHASGVAALIISAHGDRMAPDDVAERLGESATEIPCPGDEGSVRCVGDDQRNGIFGEGVVNADRAVR
ncbi:S8 family serine peptidase [Janibacter sp. YB324]|uniref:S8 family peptidase n=1 Tax=Janibacter sp. YB324 TaxID=2761047 RepID=UPI0016260B4C|nr:S8 family serine peptidase [Janibacter sp. YB324]QNF94507.1 S8 family serine peptidase [Janibacter sp. YB324]